VKKEASEIVRVFYDKNTKKAFAQANAKYPKYKAVYLTEVVWIMTNGPHKGFHQYHIKMRKMKN
jgi:hypothetical protein